MVQTFLWSVDFMKFVIVNVRDDHVITVDAAEGRQGFAQITHTALLGTSHFELSRTLGMVHSD